ncbi:MAG: GNAT family N-acetyltransferase [Pseudomonadota bacterium]
MQRETQRLLLRQLTLDDFEDFAHYFGDESLSRFVGGPCDREEAWRKMAMLVGHWNLRGFGYWAVEDKKTHMFSGCVGLWRSEAWPEMELGYWLLPKAQGKGFATEAAKAALAFATDTLNTPSLVSYVAKDNRPSIQVAQRLGAYPDGEVRLANFGVHQVYRYPV